MPAEERAWERVRSEVAAGHRAFVVCPLVGESLRVEAKSATEEYERLAAGELAGLEVGLMHGQMAPAAREEVMDRFRAGELEVLVATTVIEVGVDVPEATVMVIESADRFGIAQLHQLRGRVGPGRHGQLVLPARRRGGERAPDGGGGLDRRVRPGRGRPAGPRRRDPARGPAEGAERPAAGVADRPGRPGPARRGAPRAPTPWSTRTRSSRRTPVWPTRSSCCSSEDEGEYLFKS